MSNLLVILDLETTGLPVHPNDACDGALGVGILEVGLRIIDADKMETEDYWGTVISDPINAQYIETIQGKALEMHEKSRLWAEVQAGVGMTYKQAEAAAFSFLEPYFPDVRDTEMALGPMVGNTIQFDREIIRFFWQRLHNAFHYRNIDISTVKELCAIYNRPIRKYWKDHHEGNKPHRVLQDTLNTQKELKFYIDNFLFVED